MSQHQNFAISSAAAILAAAILLASCDEQEGKNTAPVMPEGLTLHQVDFSLLPGWSNDSLLEALPAMQRSCDKINKLENNQSWIGSFPQAGKIQDWKKWCAGLSALSIKNQLKTASNNQDVRTELEIRQYLMDSLQPYQVSFQGNKDGIFTGYYEATLQGAMTRKKGYEVPIYGIPDDLVSVDFSKIYPDMNGIKLTGRLSGSSLVPYWTRKEIESGAITNSAPVIAWGSNSVDVHILHIQGSGVLELDNGEQLQIGYAGNNGHRFKGIGKIMLERGLVSPGKGSMPALRDWLYQHPNQVDDILQENARYIFFRSLKSDGPMGAFGVPLVAGRSMAVDTRYIPLGLPLWLDTVDPDSKPLQRLMMAQDVGSAIKGAVRGDFYWGNGDEALKQAGRMKSNGQYFLLLPKK